MKFNNVMDYIKGIGITIILSGTVFLSVDYSVSKTMDKNIGRVVSKAVKDEVQPINAYIESSMVKNIIKQADKVKNDPSDIKLADVEQAIRDWKYIEEKTVFIQDKYDIMYEWYKSNILNNKK